MEIPFATSLSSSVSSSIASVPALMTSCPRPFSEPVSFTVLSPVLTSEVVSIVPANAKSPTQPSASTNVPSVVTELANAPMISIPANWFFVSMSAAASEIVS